ncbi:hypothetical protein C8R44DRAFT_881514 [Mycena epipterygia]|nr:hypothetical protein C8R44DRAFT_881514 [Mycena epipterygia]
MLKQAPNLVEARIAIDFDDELVCKYVSDKEILNYLQAPALTEIALYINEDDDHNLDYLEPLVARSGFTRVLPKHPFITELAIIIDGRCSRDAANALISHLTIPNPTASATISPHQSKIYFACTNETPSTTPSISTCYNHGAKQMIVHSNPPY